MVNSSLLIADTQEERNPEVTVVIPCFNEEATIATCIKRVLEQRSRVDLEIIIVDDGSTDRTVSMLQPFLSERVRLIEHGRNRGKGAALRTAFAQCRGDIILIQDADLEYNPADFASLLDPLRKGVSQIVYGSRNLQVNPRHSLLFRWGGQFLSIWTNLLFGSRITDEATGYKVFRREVLKRLALKSDGFEFCAEFTARALRLGEKIVEVPISYRPRNFQEGKKIRMRDGWIALWVLFKNRFFS